MDTRASAFQEHRPKLYGIAYRMLGTKADAEDTLQDAYVRWHQADVDRVRSAEAWLKQHGFAPMHRSVTCPACETRNVHRPVVARAAGR